MITSTFFNKQRLGNKLFIYASLLGISKQNDTDVSLTWEYDKYFNLNPTKKSLEYAQLLSVREDNFHYYENKYKLDEFDIDFLGYYQSEKYWIKNVDYVKEKLSFKQEYIDKADKILSFIPYKKKIAIHVRRGDYVDNPNYVLLPPIYYIKALIDNFPDWRDYGIMIFSDDIPYCRVHFGCLENVYFADGNSDIEDLILMSRCDHFIISNSTFAWWGTYLGEKPDSIVVRPKHHFAGKLLETHDIKDLYPEHWRVHDHTERLDLKDVEFVIPVKYDHEHRKQNLSLVVCVLQNEYNTNVVIYEDMGKSNVYKYFDNMEKHCNYYTTKNSNYFHRTKMLNEMFAGSSCKIVVNYDADIIIPPMQMYLAIEAIRNGYDMVYPYDGRFARMERVTWFKELEKRLDIGFVKNTIFNGMKLHDNLHSVGGCILFNRDSFLEGGGENEEFISFGDEDNERYYRFFTLGYKVKRIKGVLYHINHFTGPDSSTKNPYWKKNRELWNKIKQMNKQELLEYIKEKFTWKIK